VNHDYKIRYLYIVTIFLSAVLLFAVQPMFAKMVLPRLGGAPAVWSVALVFFQGTLLAGYAYAHALVRRFRPPIALGIHISLMLGAALTLPLAIAPRWSGTPQSGEAFWLLGLFTASIGLPFFALSANGPLLQAWFARSEHPLAVNPYFLYVASNTGSFLALIAYPLAIEPLTSLTDQVSAWSVLFCVLVALVVGCGAMVLRTTTAWHAVQVRAATAPPSVRDLLAWIALATIPAGLLIAVTAHISADIGAMPLLWVVPLALYLVTFIIVFQVHTPRSHKFAIAVQPVFIFALTQVLILQVSQHVLLLIALNLATFFVTALVCHGELARRRPAAEHLTAFFMWMAVGGMIGGLCAALIAPLMFNWIAEYPILIVLALLCRPGFTLPFQRRDWLILACAVTLAFCLAAPAIWFDYSVEKSTFGVVIGLLLLLGLIAELFRWHPPIPFAALVGISFMLFHLYQPENNWRQSVRSFFGVMKIVESSKFRLLVHGTTIHGAERLADIKEITPEHRPEPLTYYHENSALARALNAVRAHKGGPLRVAIIGLGTGSLACYAKPNDTWTFYEIDPAVVEISRDENRFTFLSRCVPQAAMVLGDARLKLSEAPDLAYDFVAVDAFSSDTIPVHLLTREAMRVYLSKLAPHGVVAMHVSNRHLELLSVVAGIAAANGLKARTNNDTKDGRYMNEAEYKFPSTVAIVARDDVDFGALAEQSGWPVAYAVPGQWVWTDDYSNILGSIIRHVREQSFLEAFSRCVGHNPPQRFADRPSSNAR
jgi:hypothetical protein